VSAALSFKGRGTVTRLPDDAGRGVRFLFQSARDAGEVDLDLTPVERVRLACLILGVEKPEDIKIVDVATAH